MPSTLSVYRHAVSARLPYFTLIVLLAGVSTLLEGGALILLIPLIQLSMSGTFGADTNLAVRVFVAVLTEVRVPLTIPALLAAFAGFTVTSVVLTWVANTAIHRLIAATDAHMRRTLFSATMGMDWPALAREKIGDLVKALNSDPVQAGIGLFNLMMATTAAISGLVYIILALLLFWPLAALTGAFGLIVYPVYIAQIRRGRRASTETSNIEARVIGDSTELLSNAKLLFSQGLRDLVARRFHERVAAYQRSRFRQDVQVEHSRLAFELMAILFVVGFLFLVLKVFDLPISTGLVFLAVFYRLAPKMVTLQGCLFRASNHGVWVRNWIERTAAYEAAAARPWGTRDPVFDTALELRSVSFRYPTRRLPAVHEVTLRLAPGEAIAIVGPSGHGKSTLVDLVTGLLVPDTGELRLDGVAFPDLDIARWQANIGLVLQEAPMFHGTVGENIALFSDRPLDMPRAREAAAQADALAFVDALPDGFDTVIGERGVQLSGGQRQRIALARALYRRPRLLILDEATSALDADTARRVVASLRALKGDTAIVVASHDETLLALADRRYRMRAGQLVDMDALAAS